MSAKGTHVKTAKVACNICSRKFTKPGLVGHMHFVHSDNAGLARLAYTQSGFGIVQNDLQSAESALKATLSDKQNELISTKVQLSDVQNKYDGSELRVKQLEVALAEAQSSNESPEFRKAILADWLEGMTYAAWEEIGKQCGYMPEGQLPKSAGAGTQKVRKIFLAKYGIIATIKQ